jgi:hypothetical protein
METKPSLILPAKRLRPESQRCRPSLIVKLTRNNIIKKLPDGDMEKLINYTKEVPGEYYKTEYWACALKNRLSLDCSPETLRLVWMDYQKNKSFSVDFTFSVQIVPKNKTSDDVPVTACNNKLIISLNKGARKVFDVNSLEKLALQQNIVDKFNKLHEKCVKIIGKDINQKELLRSLTLHAGNARETIRDLLTNHNSDKIQAIYQDCCSLSNTKIPFESFISLYTEKNGNITCLYNFYANI